MLKKTDRPTRMERLQATYDLFKSMAAAAIEEWKYDPNYVRGRLIELEKYLLEFEDRRQLAPAFAALAREAMEGRKPDVASMPALEDFIKKGAA